MSRVWTEGDSIQVAVDESGDPAAFTWHGLSHPIAYIALRWSVQTDWWSEAGEVHRECFRVVTRTGLLCDLFFDVLAQGWRLHRLFD